MVAPNDVRPNGATGDDSPSPSQFGILSEDDIAIEGMALVFLKHLETRGYAVPPGLTKTPEDMPTEELEMETQLFQTVLDLPRHRSVIDSCVPYVEDDTIDGDDDEQPIARRTKRRSAPASYPAVSSTVNTELISEPSALLLCAWLSILISLQAEFEGFVQETDPGVDGELRLFKARRELGECLYRLVEGLLDSYLLSADSHEGDEERDVGEKDALVQLLFHDMALRYDSLDRATCALDLILNLSSYLLIEAESLVSHPVVLATTEYVWRNGLFPSPDPGTDSVESLSWKNTLLLVDRFSTPRILQAQTYVFSTIQTCLTIYILMVSSYGRFYAFNPFAPGPDDRHPAKHPHSPSLFHSLVWIFWITCTLGWALEVARAWNHRGPHPTLPLSPSTLLPLLYHSLVFVSLAVRTLALLTAPSSLMLSTSLNMLAWSVPFLAASRILPQNLPPFGSPTHHQWFRLVDGRKSRDVGYRPPPKSVPESHRALRSIEQHLGGLIQFRSYFFVVGGLLLYSLSGELDYNTNYSLLLITPETISNATESISFFAQQKVIAPAVAVATAGRTVGPLEARTALAFTLVLGLILAYFAGGRPSVSEKSRSFHASASRSVSDLSGLHDLDGWDRYGREVAFRARRERLAVARYYLYVPHLVEPSVSHYAPLSQSGTPQSGGGSRSGNGNATEQQGPSNPNVVLSLAVSDLEDAYTPEGYDSVPPAFSVPPLTPPFNLLEPPMELVGFVCRQLKYESLGRLIETNARLYIWRVSMSGIAVWALGAKLLRILYNAE